MSTPLQLEANRANALLSTGPLSPASKAISSLNALKTGLTGRTILLPSDDLAAYQQHVARLEAAFEPATGEEKQLVQNIADDEWRLLRIPVLEAGIYALGRLKYAEMFEDQPDLTQRAALLEVHIFQNHRKELSNIHLQEVRLNRQCQRRKEELAKLQHARQAFDRDRLSRAYQAYTKASRQRETFNTAEFGFEFSEEFLEARYRYLSRYGELEAPAFDRAWKLNRLKNAA